MSVCVCPHCSGLAGIGEM